MDAGTRAVLAAGVVDAAAAPAACLAAVVSAEMSARAVRDGATAPADRVDGAGLATAARCPLPCMGPASH